MKKISYKTMKALNELFKRLNNLRRWTAHLTEGKYNELSKQALNCLICYILASENEAKGETVNWELFPKISIYRAFQKAYVNYDTPEHILKEICDLGKEISFNESFKNVTYQIIVEQTNEEFAKFIAEGCGTQEERIYKAATKIATLLEFKETKEDDTNKYRAIIESMEKYKNVLGFEEMSDENGNYFKVLSSISKLRNQNRWAAYSYNINCSVLGHLYDTAIFAYEMALERGEEKSATKCFFMGIFHDVPEAFTRDIPSPIKDKIPGFRNLTEQYELKMMEKYIYPLVSEVTCKKLKGIMFEDSSNMDYKRFMKGADYMSAVSELWRQLKAGSRDETFVTAIKFHGEKFQSVASISKNGQQLYDETLKWAEKLDL